MQQRFLFFIPLLLLLNACWQKKPIATHYGGAQSIAINNMISDSTNNALPLLNTYRAAMNKTMDVVIGVADVELKKDKPNGTLGSMVADAMLMKAKQMDAACVIAISNYGGIRIPSLPKGNLTLGKIYELMPFENTLSIVPLSGYYLDTLCQKMARSGGMPISGLTFGINNNKAINIKINGEALDFSKSYKTCVNSYMASGGDECEFMIALPKQSTTVLIRDAILAFINMQNTNKQSLVIEPIQRITH